MATRTRNTRRRDASGHVDPFYQRRHRLDALLDLLGLRGDFAKLPRRVQEHFWRCKMPDPVLRFDAGVPDDGPYREMRRDLTTAFRDAAFEVDGRNMSVRDYFAVAEGLQAVTAGTKEVLPEPTNGFLRAAGPRIERFCDEQKMPALRALYDATYAPTLAHSRLDTRLFTSRLNPVTIKSGKIGVSVDVSAALPVKRHVRLDGVDRGVYRVAKGGEPEARWLSWQRDAVAADESSLTFGAPEAPDARPVYVQSHALRQLYRRANVPAAAPYLESWMWESLVRPNVVERQGDDLLVEFRLGDDRVGYLVVTPRPDLVVVRTFKFLTMEGTPEARALHRRLRLTRRDIDWLGLHELAAYTQSDLVADPELRPLLEKCGCGQLFTLGQDFTPETPHAAPPTPTPIAADVRRYLRMAA